MNKLMILLLLTYGSCISRNQERVESTFEEDKKPYLDSLMIFLLIGQSNMAGRANIEIKDLDTLSNIYLFTGEGDFPWEKAANPLNKYSTVRKDIKMQKLGLGYSFSKSLSKNFPNKKIGLVVNARGGTSISEWMQGEELYDESIKQIKKAMRFGKLTGILWHQGASDIVNPDYDPEVYFENQVKLIKQYRSELGVKNLPFVVGQATNNTKERMGFNEMILDLELVVPYTAVVRSEGTEVFDGLHFDSKSQRLLGDRYAEKILNFLQEKG